MRRDPLNCITIRVSQILIKPLYCCSFFRIFSVASYSAVERPLDFAVFPDSMVLFCAKNGYIN